MKGNIFSSFYKFVDNFVFDSDRNLARKYFYNKIYEEHLKIFFQEYKEKRTQNKKELEKIIKENINHFTDDDRKILLLLAISNGSVESVNLLLGKDLSEKKLNMDYSMNLLEANKSCEKLPSHIPAEDRDFIAQQFHCLQEGVIAIQNPKVRIIIDKMRLSTTTLSPAWLLEYCCSLQQYFLDRVIPQDSKLDNFKRILYEKFKHILYKKIKKEQKNIHAKLVDILQANENNMKETTPNYTKSEYLHYLIFKHLPPSPFSKKNPYRWIPRAMKPK